MSNIHSNIEILKTDKHLYDLMDLFTKSFDITRGVKVKILGSVVCAFTLKPNKLISESFGIEKELLLIYANYSEIQARTFQASDYLFSTTEFMGRVDPLMYLLLSPASNLYSLTKQQSIENTLSRIIVPVLSQELTIQGKDQFYLFNKMKEFLFSRDLFDFQQPITSDLYFFGRSKLIQELRHSLENGENIGLFGLRKTGKTSVLLKLQRLLENNHTTIYKYIDLQDPSLYSMRWWELLDHVRLQIGGDQIKNISASTASKTFKDTIDKKSKKTNNIIIAFDEIEHICPTTTRKEHWNQDFLEFWKALRAIQNINRKLTFITAGVNATPIETPIYHGHDNPLFSMIKIKYIDPLEEVEVKDMLTTLGKHIGITLENELITIIYNNYGGHPLLSRLAASTLHKELINQPKPLTINAEHFISNKESINKILIPFCNHILGVLKEWYPSEYSALETLVCGDVEEFNSIAREIPEYILHLESYGILVKNSNSVRIPILADFIRNENSKRQKTPDEKPQNNNKDLDWLELSNLRNQLEPKLRKFIKRILKSHLGDAKWIEPIIALLPEERKRQCLGVDANLILDERLFLSDILNLMINKWNDYFKILEAGPPDRKLSKAQCQVILDFVNAHREDAHAKSVSHGVIASMHVACNAINTTVNRYLED